MGLRRFQTFLAALLLGMGLIGVTSTSAAAAGDLPPGGTLGACRDLVAPNGQYLLSMQCDGNLVVYVSAGHVATWSSRTNGSSGAYLAMQGDGNLVIYLPGGQPIWSTGTQGVPGTSLEMQSDGNLVLYGPGHVARWSSKSPMESAISWFYGRIGSTAYEGYCERAVENAFGVSNRYPSAIANWNARDKRYPYSAAPRGALVFYNTSANGHVALSLGNGQLISSSVNGRIGIAGLPYFQNPLGWAYAPW